MIGDTVKESLLNKNTGSTANPERWVDEHGDCLYRYAFLAVRNPAVARILSRTRFWRLYEPAKTLPVAPQNAPGYAAS
jgi:hypothetical protein